MRGRDGLVKRGGDVSWMSKRWWPPVLTGVTQTVVVHRPILLHIIISILLLLLPVLHVGILILLASHLEHLDNVLRVDVLLLLFLAV